MILDLSEALASKMLLPRARVNISPEQIDAMSVPEFNEFAVTHLRWYIESYGFFQAEGGAGEEPIRANLTPHQVELLAIFVTVYFIKKIPKCIFVVGKHRRAYVTTFWMLLFWALARLMPGFKVFAAANKTETTEKLRDQFLLQFEDNMYLGPGSEDGPAFKISLRTAAGDMTQSWTRRIMRERIDENTGHHVIVEEFVRSGGSYIDFKSAGGRMGAAMQGIHAALFSEGGMNGPPWDLVVKRTINALPKTDPGICVIEGTAEEFGTYINEIIDIAMAAEEQGLDSHVFVFLRWWDDVKLQLPLRKGQKIPAIGGNQAEKEKDKAEVARIIEAFKEAKGYDEQAPGVQARLDQQITRAINYRQRIGLPSLNFDAQRWSVDHPAERDDMNPIVQDTMFNRADLVEKKRAQEKIDNEIRALPEDERPLFPMELPIVSDLNGRIMKTLTLLKSPEVRRERLITVDSSSGLSEGGDPSAAEVFAWGEDSTVEVEAVHDGVAEPDELAQIVFVMAQFYRNQDGRMPLVVVEREEFGRAVMTALERMKTEAGESVRLYYMRSADREGGIAKVPGFTSRRFGDKGGSKLFGAAYLKQWLPKWTLNYMPSIAQLGRFGKTSSGEMKGQRGANDELVDTKIMAAFVGVEIGRYRPKTTVSTPKGHTVPLPHLDEPVPDDDILAELFPNLGVGIRAGLKESPGMGVLREHLKSRSEPVEKTVMEAMLEGEQEMASATGRRSDGFPWNSLRGLL